MVTLDGSGKRATIDDVALAAGVSRAAVSKVIRARSATAPPSIPRTVGTCGPATSTRTVSPSGSPNSTSRPMATPGSQTPSSDSCEVL